MGKLPSVLNILANRNPKLDALRGVSILLVLTTHGLFSLKFLGLHILLPEKNLRILQSNGYLGVSIFFVISGYLITRSLLHKNEHSIEGQTTTDLTVDAPTFYAKRFARIFPPLIFLFLVTFVLGVSTSDFFDRFHVEGFLVLFLAIVHAFTFTYNNFYFFGLGGRAESLSHLVPLWSLSIEEVFYLVWPILIIVFRKRRIILMILSLLFLYSMLYRIEYGSGALYSYFGCVDMLATGCFVALIQENKIIHRLLKYSQIGLLFTSLLLFYLLVSLDIHTNYVLAPTLVGLTSGVYVLFGSAKKLKRSSKIGVTQVLIPLRVLGFLSYELYLFHLIFWNLFYKYDVTNNAALLSTLFPLVITVLICLGLHLLIFEPARKMTYNFFRGRSV